MVERTLLPKLAGVKRLENSPEITYTATVMDDQPTPPAASEPAAPPTPERPRAVQKIGKIVVDRELCIGAASCVALAGATFELDGENKAVVVNPKGDIDEDILAAAVSCPTNAIFLYDEDGNQIHPPK